MLLDLFYLLFLIEIHRLNAMVDHDNNRPEVSLLFVEGCSTYLHVEQI
jgi:hypothetical protein